MFCTAVYLLEFRQNQGFKDVPRLNSGTSKVLNSKYSKLTIGGNKQWNPGTWGTAQIQHKGGNLQYIACSFFWDASCCEISTWLQKIFTSSWFQTKLVAKRYPLKSYSYAMLTTMIFGSSILLQCSQTMTLEFFAYVVPYSYFPLAMIHLLHASRSNHHMCIWSSIEKIWGQREWTGIIGWVKASSEKYIVTYRYYIQERRMFI